MTLDQFITAVRNRHRAIGDTNWSDPEIADLLTHRINESLIHTGLLQDTDASDVTVASQQAYTIPTDAIHILIVNVNGEMLQEITFRDWEAQKTGGTTTTGKPIQYIVWNREILMVPVPSVAGQTITYYYEKQHPYIDTVTQTTIDLPSAIHGNYISPVLADMFAKDLNQPLAQFYEQKWQTKDLPGILWYQKRSRRGGRVKTLVDCDSHPVTDRGMY